MKMIAGNTTTIGGPAIYAALGVRYAGISTALLTAVGRDLTDVDNAIAISIDDECIPLRTKLPRSMITWSGPAILGATGKGTLSDNPSLWRAMPPKNYNMSGHALILANGDPDWYQTLLTACTPSLIFMDAHIEWLRIREKSLNACLQKAHVVTITETEYKALPLSVRSGVSFGGNDKALIIKRGSQGVTIIAGNQRRELPPPKPMVTRTDVGCGDLLVGSLAGHFLTSSSTEAPQTLIDRLTQAYLDSITPLTKLIESDSPRTFIGHCITQLQSRQSANEVQ
ncbi:MULTISPECIES: carbohydrate kinase family protein [unclassified Herbaspirillum]|uniref:carbohydrate kinase family protein n=1 Tax=unclassified Herbaspirillum TaxID=2624150 RepID=UPI0011515123|nr:MULTISPECIES: carbohydrate kinase family protein [unclassified Herbaspirillum]MBB5393827.1 hypothetical protein [Herbaspirillum sp. SJZ102]